MGSAPLFMLRGWALQAADAGAGYDVIFYGDSLTEMWRGTRSDQPYPPRSMMPGAPRSLCRTHVGPLGPLPLSPLPS